MEKSRLLALALLSCSTMVLAQAATDTLLQPAPLAPLALAAQHSIPVFEGLGPEVSAVAEPEDRLITVNSLRLTGARSYSATVLLARTGFRSGSQLTVADLRAMAARVVEFYRGKGYVLARAWLPAQDILGGNVTIAVEEGR
jgi:hemolysin activation/secretion protein